MKNLKLIYLIIAFAIFYSCTEKNTRNKLRNENIMHFEIPQNLNKDNVKRFYTSNIYSKIDGFELDRTAGPIGDISKALIYKDILFAFDNRYAKKIFAFDLKNQGKFLFKIGIQGKGPGEFLMITDFTIDKISNSLVVSDVRQRKLSYFKLDGTYYDEKKLDFSPLTLFCDSNYYYFVIYPEGETGSGMVITDKKMMEIRKLFPISEYPTNANINSKFIECNKRTFFNYNYCDSIYEIKDGNLKPYLALSSDGKSLFSYLKNTQLEIETKRNLFMKLLSSHSIIPEKENVFIPQVYFEDSKIQMFSFFKNGEHKFMVDIKNNSLSPSLGYISENMIGAAFKPIGYDEKYGTISTLNFNQLNHIKDSLLKINKHRISKRLIEDIDNFNADSNPFVVFYN